MTDEPQVIDRISPTFRPKGRASGFQKWRDLLFLHWEVPAELIQPLLPKNLIVDTFDGRAFLGLVPFVMKEIRPSWWKLTKGLNFLETNVRTYVTHKNVPGVYFFTLDANSIAAVLAAYLGWSLPYYVSSISLARHEQRILYRNRRFGSQAYLNTQYTVGELLGSSQALTLEHFLLERYLLFVKHAGVIHCGQVYHTPYPVHRVEVESIEQNMFSPLGFPKLDRPPDLAHFSPGVDVEIFPMIAKP